MQRTIGALSNQTAFISETEATLNQQLEVLTSLTTALLGELEFLHSTVTAVQTNSNSGPDLPLMGARRADFRIDFYEEVERYEIGLIKRALQESCGNQRRAAQRLAMNSSTLNAKIKHYGIQINPDGVHTGDLTSQCISLDGSHRPAGVRAALILHDAARATAEPENAPTTQCDSFLKCHDFE